MVAGQNKISTTESQVSMGDKLLSLSPKVKEYSEGVTEAIQKKIGEGKTQVEGYTIVYESLAILGSIFLIAGIWLSFFRKKVS